MLLYPTRRRLLTALGAAGLVLDDVLAEPLAPTPQCHDGDAPTVRQTEGPYFKPSSPQRADLVEPNSKARLVELGGQVLTRSCRPVAGALVDLWHADERGDYDNAGFRYRGHLFNVSTVRPCLSMSAT
jgi:protocatechuate 3,4-dioxygenase beta subunit